MGGRDLALVTCTPQLEVGMAGEGLAGASVVRLAGRAPRSRLLLAAADLLLEDAGGGRDSLGRIVVTRGPGSFTGIRAGLATAHGLSVALHIPVLAYDSLLAQAARVDSDGTVWAAQPGRRGEVYGQQFRTAAGAVPEALTGIEVLGLEDVTKRGPWVAAPAVELGGGARVPVARSTVEALFLLIELAVPSGPLEPLYVEGPPVGGGR